MSSSTLGQFGESYAVGMLTRKGYRVLDRNVRFRRGEIDLVAVDGSVLVFVEVKTRRTRAFGDPQASITRERYRRLAGAVEEYVSRLPTSPGEYRIDVLALTVDSKGRVSKSELLKGVECPPT